MNLAEHLQNITDQNQQKFVDSDLYKQIITFLTNKLSTLAYNNLIGYVQHEICVADFFVDNYYEGKHTKDTTTHLGDLFETRYNHLPSLDEVNYITDLLVTHCINEGLTCKQSAHGYITVSWDKNAATFMV